MHAFSGIEVFLVLKIKCCTSRDKAPKCCLYFCPCFLQVHTDLHGLYWTFSWLGAYKVDVYIAVLLSLCVNSAELACSIMLNVFDIQNMAIDRWMSSEYCNIIDF